MEKKEMSSFAPADNFLATASVNGAEESRGAAEGGRYRAGGSESGSGFG